MRKIWLLNVTAMALMGSGIAIACAGRDTLRWSPPPLPPAWAGVSDGLADGRTAVFLTSSVALYLKTAFPSDRVYGYTPWPTLRLVIIA